MILRNDVFSRSSGIGMLRERERERERGGERAEIVNARLKRESYRKVYKKIKTTRKSIYIRLKTEKYKEKERKKTNEMC